MAGDLEVDHRRLHQRGDSFVDRYVDFLAAAAAMSLVERRHRADDREHGGQRITKTDARPRRRQLRISRREADTADSFTDAAEPGLRGTRPCLSEAGDVHHDQPRVPRTGRSKPHSPFIEPTGPKVLENDIAAVDQLSHHFSTGRVAHIDGDRLLVAGDRRPPQALAVAGDAPLAHRITGAGRLDLDHLRAVVAEQLPGKRTGDEAAHLQNPNSVERPESGSGFSRHAPALYGPSRPAKTSEFAAHRMTTWM